MSDVPNSGKGGHNILAVLKIELGLDHGPILHQGKVALESEVRCKGSSDHTIDTPAPRGFSWKGRKKPLIYSVGPGQKEMLMQRESPDRLRWRTMISPWIHIPMTTPLC